MKYYLRAAAYIPFAAGRGQLNMARQGKKRVPEGYCMTPTSLFREGEEEVLSLIQSSDCSGRDVSTGTRPIFSTSPASAASRIPSTNLIDPTTR